jgi:hypothetical protein
MDLNNMRMLSSKMTFYYKFIFPTLWITGFAFATILMFTAPDSFKGNKDIREVRPIFLTLTIGGTVFFYWCCMRLKKVSLKDNVLIVSNFSKEIVIPFCDVDRVSGSIMMHPELVWLHLRRPTDLGTKIVFTPRGRWFSGFTPHPIVNELQKLTEAAYAGPQHSF